MKEEKWKRFVETYEIEVSPEEVENEANLIRMNLRHSMQYDALMGNHVSLFPEKELDEQMEEIRQQAYQDLKAEYVMKDLLRKHEFSVSREELEAEAQAMAERQSTTVDMIKTFFGEDLEMLKRDILERKAMEWAEKMIQ